MISTLQMTQNKIKDQKFTDQVIPVSTKSNKLYKIPSIFQECMGIWSLNNHIPILSDNHDHAI